MQELDACSCEGKRFVHLENIQVLAFKASDEKNETNRLTFQCTSYIMDHSRQRQKIWVLDRERTVVTLFVADDNINIHYDLLDTCVQKVHLSIWTRLQNCGVEVFDFYNTESLLTVVCDMKYRVTLMCLSRACWLNFRPQISHCSSSWYTASGEAARSFSSKLAWK